MAGNSFSYRVNPLTTSVLISPPPLVLLQRIARHTIEWDNDTFNPDTLNLAAITKRDSGECLFACIAMALYGTEDEHAKVRSDVCNFIDCEIVSNYYTLSESDKLRLMLFFDKVSEVALPPTEFQKVADSYMKKMRLRKTCGTHLEFAVASYMFRLRVILLNKNTHILTDGTSIVTYGKPTLEMEGASIVIPGLMDDGIGNVATQDAAGRAAAQQCIVLMLLKYTFEDEIAGVRGAGKKARQVVGEAERQQQLLSEETLQVGHYELMEQVSDIYMLQMLQERFEKEDRDAVANQKRVAAKVDGNGKDAGGPSKPRKTKRAALEIQHTIQNMKDTEYTSLLANMKSIKLARRYLSERNLENAAIARAYGPDSKRIPRHPHEETDQQIMQKIVHCEHNITECTEQFASGMQRLAELHGSKQVAPHMSAQAENTKDRLSGNYLRVALEIGMNDDIAKHIDCAQEVHKLNLRRADIDNKYQESNVALAEIQQDIAQIKTVTPGLQADLKNIQEYRQSLIRCRETDRALMALLDALKK